MCWNSAAHHHWYQYCPWLAQINLPLYPHQEEPNTLQWVATGWCCTNMQHHVAVLLDCDTQRFLRTSRQRAWRRSYKVCAGECCRHTIMCCCVVQRCVWRICTCWKLTAWLSSRKGSCCHQQVWLLSPTQAYYPLPLLLLLLLRPSSPSPPPLSFSNHSSYFFPFLPPLFQIQDGWWLATVWPLSPWGCSLVWGEMRDLEN